MHTSWAGLCILCVLRILTPVVITFLFGYLLNKLCNERNGENGTRKETNTVDF